MASVVVVEGDADESVVSDEMGGIQLAVSVIFSFSLCALCMSVTYDKTLVNAISFSPQ